MVTSGGIQVGWGEQWETLANAINDYYGGGIGSTQYQQVVQMLNSGEYTMEEMESVIGGIPEFNRVYNAEGKLTSVTYNATATGNTAVGNIANEINSNVAGGTNTQFQTVQTITKDSQTGKVTMSDSVKKYNSGTATTTKAIATSTVQGILAAGVGIRLGKTISQLAYDSGFNYLEWAGVSMESLNPETWAKISEEASEEHPFRSAMFNMIFDLDPNTGNPQAYIDENAFAYMAAYMSAVGVFSGQEVVEPYEGEVGSYVTVDDMWKMSAYDFVNRYISPSAHSDYSEQQIAADFFSGTYQNYIAPNDIGVVSAGGSDNDYLYWYKLDPDDTQRKRLTEQTGEMFIGEQFVSTEHGEIEAYYNNGSQISTLFSFNNAAGYGTHYLNVTEYPRTNRNEYGLYIGSITYENIEGITNQTGATQFDDSGLDPTDIAAILAALMTQFPELWDNRIEVSPDGDTVINYIPIGFPTGGVGQAPTTDGATAADTRPDISGQGSNATDELIKTLIDLIQQPYNPNGMESDTDTPTAPIDPNDDGTGSGNTPPFVIPTGSASALYSVYNPTQAQLNSLGAWLWSSNFVDQLLKLFNDPMQAIIGLHKIFASPPVSGVGSIKVGYLDSGVSANLVSGQYTEVDCGKVKLSEFFKNELDYTKTDVYLYLPFIGIVPLSVDDVMRANIEVKYKVDVLTGACLAAVNVYRDSNSGGQLYTYAGNCAVQYPLSSGSYMGIISGILGIAGGVASTIISGGAMLPMALTAGAGVMSRMKTNVQHSGSLSGNSGAMGIKKPYLIIRRPQTKIAANFETMNGVSQNEFGVLGSYAGYTRVSYVHLENIPATSEELTEIENYLKSGVLI